MFLKKLINNIFPQQGIVILMYHSVGHNQVEFTVKPEDFSEQMKYLVNNKFSIISFASMVDLVKEGTDIPDKTIVLTFDDGYQDLYEYAWPTLKKYELPATVFVATGFAGRQLMTSENIALDILDWDQIKQMNNLGIDFQPHGHSHKKLDQLDDQELAYEIDKSKSLLETRLHKKCFFFAYPKGRYNSKVVEVLKKNEFIAARSVENGVVTRKSNLFILPKISINSKTTITKFKKNVCGIY